MLAVLHLYINYGCICSILANALIESISLAEYLVAMGLGVIAIQ